MIHKIDENILLSEPGFQKQRCYWTRKLTPGMEKTGLPFSVTENNRPQQAVNIKRDTIDFAIPQKLCREITRLSKNSDLSIYILLLTGLKSLIYRYNYTYADGSTCDSPGNRDITVLSPVYKFDISDKTLNDFLFIRDTFHGGITFKELLLEVRQSVLEAYDHQDYPLDRVLEDSSVTHILCLLENIHLSFRAHPGREALKDKLVFSFLLEGSRISGGILFDPGRYEPSYMEKIPGHLFNLLAGAMADINIKISQIPYLSEEERGCFLYEFNDTAARYPRDKTVVRLFSEQARKTPDRTALSRQQSHYLTYGELNRKSGQLAYLLQTKGLRPGTIAGIITGPSTGAVIGLLGILKAGATYLPIEPRSPGERIRFILTDSNTNILLTTRQLFEESKDGCAGKWEGRTIFPEECFYNLSVPPVSPVAEQQPAYIIYTSGSTGVPKGVMVEHRGLVNYLHWAGKMYIDPDGTRCDFPFYSSLAFDLTVTSIYLPLISGNTLHVYEEDGDEFILAKIFRDNRVRVVKLTPTHLRLAADLDIRDSAVKRFIVGGEALTAALADRVYREFSGKIDIYNEYGPTETVVGCMIYKFNPGENRGQSVPIGKPADNVWIYLLDRELQPVPGGVTAEIYISGDGVARGYLNNPELTCEKFKIRTTSNEKFCGGSRGAVFQKRPPGRRGQKIYKTGDLARRLADGNLEYLGRTDRQVKIRGYRIELREIQVRLEKHHGIEKSVVTSKIDKEGNNYLCAYVTVGSRGHEPAVGSVELREYLSRTLPGYMIPDHFVRVEKIPLTTNGKVDLKALEGIGAALGSRVRYTAPKSEIEKKLVEIWSEVLGTSGPIGVDDNFFDIGGNSLSILRVHGKLKEIPITGIPVVKMFRYPTIGSLAAYLGGEGIGEPLGGGGKLKQRAWRWVDGIEIAVIGMAGRFPGAKNISRFRANLEKGVESIRFFSDGELGEAGIDPGLSNNPDYVGAGGILENKEFFDASFFGYIPAEAEIMDPQARIFHECAWEALEDAGYNPEIYHGSIGLFMGASNSFDWMAMTHLSGKSETLAAFEVEQLTSRDFLSTRISYKLHLTGPSITLQTACSTSLAAIHMASRAVLTGECDMALAGGVSVAGPKARGYLYREGMINSPDGHCRAFDIQAKGTVAGEGAGIVALKRLKDAGTDGDHIYAVIKGSAVNNDGVRKVGYSAPGVEGQAEVIRDALRAAAVEPGSIGYIETHGTATTLGDPIEIEALTMAFATGKKRFCPIGSVKTNIGHLDAAAGAAGFIKTVLALKHRRIPPSLFFNTPNPNIDFENSPFYVNTTLREWHPRRDDKGNAYPLRAGVSSFGIGGTNVHVVLEEAPSMRRQGTDDRREKRKYQLIPLSAKTGTALEQASRNLACHLRENPGIDLADAAYTLQAGRKAFAHRKIAVCSGLEEAVEILTAPGADRIHTNVIKQENPGVIFLFPGQGSQYVNMGRELYREEAVFREEMDRCFEILKPPPDYDIKEILYPSSTFNGSDINRTEIAQPLLFIFEYSLAKLLMKWGIEPGAMMGHSIGEYVAACLAGVLSLEDALKLVVLRGKSMQEMPGGSLLTVPLSREQLEPLLKNRDLSLAAVNSSSLCVVSGPGGAVDDFEKQLTGNGHKVRLLHTSHAFHSRMMDPILAEFEAKVREIKLDRPAIPYISNLTGAWVRGHEVVEPGYWAAHIRQTVQFSKGLSELLKQTDTIFVEVGPGKSLSAFVRQHSDKTDRHRVVNLVRHPGENDSDVEYLWNRLGLLWLYGKSPDWEKFYRGEKRQRIPLPTYPFEGRAYWLGGDPANLAAVKEVGQAKKPDMADWFYVPSWELVPRPPGKETPGPLFSLIFADRYGLGNQLAEKLQARTHHDDHTVVIVQKGKKFARIGELTYTLNPASKDDYLTLVREMQQLDCMPRQVIHCWNVTPAPNSNSPGDEDLTVKTVKDSLTTGFYSLVYLAKALKDRGGNSDIIRFYVLVNRMVEVVGGEHLSPGKAVLLGPCRVIPQEFPRFRCTAVDTCFPPAKKAGEKEILEHLCAELSLPHRETETVIAYRGKRRWVQSFKPVRLEETDGTPYLREKGVYLVTGAPGDHGSMGFILARYLARRVNARLALVGRTPFPPKDRWDQWLARSDSPGTDGSTARITRKIRLVRELEHMGAEVLVLNADVSDIEQFSRAAAQTEKRFGKINGVIHAAALMGKDLLAFMVDNDDGNSKYEKQFIPKIYGLLTLYRVFKDKNLDFCLLTSSLGSVMGPFAAYSAACNFMDAFAHRVNQREKGWVSVDWDNWRPLEQPDQPGNKAENLELFMTPGEGVEAFHRILSWSSAANTGQVLTSTGDLEARLARVPGKKEPVTGLPAVRNARIAEWFYKPAWKNSPLSIPVLTLEKNSVDSKLHGWLVFTGNTGPAAGVAERLNNAGHNVVTVEIGTDFVRNHERGFTIHPGEAGHYCRLFRELEESREVPRRILHCWNVTGPGEQDVLDTGLHSLIFIARAIGNLRSPPPMVQLAVVSRNMQPVTGKEELCPEKAALLAPVKIIPFEYSNITCRSIDIGHQEPDGLMDRLLLEFETDFTRQPVVAYRDNQRLRQHFEPVKLGPIKGAGSRLKEKGVYLVTGGLGGMGFFIAQHLGKYFKAKLILTDTTDFPGREHWQYRQEQEDTDTRQKIQCILELEKQGAQLMVRQADVSDYDGMQAVIIEAQQRFGVIDGIFHTAGLIDYAGVMQRRTRRDTEELLAAKVKGTLVLDRIFHDHPLDFLVLFSSAGNILYGLKFGQVGYNAGHEFLDVYAHHKKNQGVFTVTIDWNDWLEVGMSVRAAGKSNITTHETSMADEIFSISPEEGIGVLKRILENPYPQIAVSTHELARLIQGINNPRENVTRLLDSSTGTAGSGAPAQRPELTVEYRAPSNKTEKIMVRIWQDFFDIQPIGIDDDFFELGGDSLKAMTIIGLVHNKLNVKIPLAEFFKGPSIKGLSRCLEGAEQHQYNTIPRALAKDYYPLSSAQKRIYIIQQVQPEEIVFNESSAMEMQGELDRETLENTFRQLIQRHESLRTSFQLVNEEPMQKIHHKVEFEIEYYSSGRGESGLSGTIKSFVRPFDLSLAPLLRVGLVKKEENHFIMIIDTHHIISDGSSMGIFIKEFMAVYAGEIVPPLTAAYKDYSEWQNSEAGQEIMAQQETYWLQQFQGPPPRLNLPIDYPRPSIQRFQGNTRRFEIDFELSEMLKKLALKEETSLFMVMFAIFNILLWRLSQQEHIITGTPAAGRRHVELQQVIGMFVNTLALEVHIQPGETFKEFLARVTQQALQAFENQDYQFEDLVNRVETRRQAGRNPIFDVMFELHNVADQDFSIPGLTIKPYESENPISRFDLTLKVFQWEKVFSFSLTYSTALFKEETIDVFINYFSKLLETIPRAVDKRLSQVEMLSQTGKAEVMADVTDDLENE